MQNNQYERLLFIDAIISDKKLPTWKDLVRMLENAGFKSSRASLFRDLTDMKKNFNAPVETDKKDRYFYTDEDFHIPALLTSNEQILAAQIARNLLEKIKGTEIYNDAVKLFDGADFPDSGDFASDDKFFLQNPFAARVIFLGARDANFSWSSLIFIFLAIKKNRNIVFDYETENQKTASHTVAPYQLIFENGSWLLWGFDYRPRKNILFTLSQIKNLHLRSLEGKTFEFALPKDFDFRKTTLTSFGSFSSPYFYTFKIQLKNSAVLRAKSKIWGDEQKITQIEDGIILEFESNQYDAILRWILSLAEDAKPLEPKELVADWKNHIQKMFSSLC